MVGHDGMPRCRWHVVQPLVAMLCVALASCAPGPATNRRTVDLPFSRCTFTVGAGTPVSAAVDAALPRIEQVFRELDMYRADSEVSAINRAAGRGPVHASPDLLAALDQALLLAEASGGRFDPTVAPLVRLWGIGGKNPRVPSDREIESARALIDWRKVRVDRAAASVALEAAGMALDFGAVIKGLAAVEAGKLLAARGISSAVVDIGGSVVAVGSGPGGRPWRVGVQKPGAPRGTSLGIVRVRDEVVNTSGLYEQYFLSGGVRYAHIFDTSTGRPVSNGVEAVTVIRDRRLNADGPSLAILASGPVEGLALARRLGVEAVIVGSDRTLRITDGIRGRFELLDPSYSIVP